MPKRSIIFNMNYALIRIIFKAGQSMFKDLRQINKDTVEFLTGVPSDQLSRGVEITNVSRHSMQHGSRVRFAQKKIQIQFIVTRKKTSY
jgi:hypothetical protein